ncbi:hypothetical protein O181_028332 [Austropuccinia psidii MF-1]|uniref:Uncharacterized protein n=1 Tax=Austropuccinia psidii MF-1 TaxID=1389203 RepID=A0A9Q3CRP1_9BASI|nr:hypothetical protein [Austropuccinia psidii MF-1]
MTPDFEEEGPVLSKSSKPAPELPKDSPKRPHKKNKGPKNNQLKGKEKANFHRPYPKWYRIPQLEPSAMDCVQHGKDSYGVHSQRTIKITRTFPEN